jgi:NADH dehydrogenase FAD-containing subunit
MKSDVLVVGGGYAGTLVAKELDDRASVTLVDSRDSFVNYSASLRAMVREDWAEAPFFCYGTLLKHGTVVHGTVVSVDDEGARLSDGRRLDAHYLVLATGSSYAYPAHPRPDTTVAQDAAAQLRATGRELAQAKRVLILGSGPVGLELAGEIREAWPNMEITVVSPSTELLPGYLPEVHDELIAQLDRLGIDLQLGTRLSDEPSVPPAVAQPFTVTTTDGRTITADIWFRTFGARVNTDYLADARLVELTAKRLVPVDEHLAVVGHPNVYALGDIADLPDAKMATHAQTQAAIVIDNLTAQLEGRQPSVSYQPAAMPRIFLPLGSGCGVGQVPTPDGPIPAPLDAVIERKGRDLFTSRFAERFGLQGTE